MNGCATHAGCAAQPERASTIAQQQLLGLFENAGTIPMDSR
jgi:hypothetical protein